MLHPKNYTELKPLIYQCAHILTEGLQPVSDMLLTPAVSTYHMFTAGLVIPLSFSVILLLENEDCPTSLDQILILQENMSPHSPRLPVALPAPGCSGCMRCYKLPDRLHPGCWFEHWSSAVAVSYDYNGRRVSVRKEMFGTLQQWDSPLLTSQLEGMGWVSHMSKWCSPSLGGS